MKITIVTPSFNQGHYIEDTIKSVLNQQGDFDLEYFVIDGGSTDNTLEILKKYEDKLTWVSESDNGQTHAINKGLKNATGDIVAYINSDDLYVSGAFQNVVNFFQKYPEKNWAYGKCRIINEQGKEIRKWITTYKNLLLKRYSYNKLLTENFVSQPATFWRRNLLDEIGYLDEDHHLVMDYEYWLRIGNKYDAGVISKYLAEFRWYTDSKSGTQFKNQFKEELEMATKYAGKKKWTVRMHKFNYWKITGIYSILKKLKK